MYKLYPYYAIKVLTSLLNIGYGYFIASSVLFKNINYYLFFSLLFYTLNASGVADAEWLLYYSCLLDLNTLNLFLLSFS